MALSIGVTIISILLSSKISIVNLFITISVIYSTANANVVIIYL